MKNILFLIFLISIASCSQQQARKPISHSEGSFMKESVERNKKLVANEEKVIDSIIKSNPKIKYAASKKGYWFYYLAKNETDTITPKRGDIAYFDYDVKDIYGNVIYTKDDLKPQVYNVDKQNIMMGLRDGIKIMHKKETVVFLFTSNMGYGYHGDNDKISTNESLICTVTLNDFKSSESRNEISKPIKKMTISNEKPAESEVLIKNKELKSTESQTKSE
ncbi:MAG: gliding motility-associated peptidyl-prolyl isomerase GldI [Flavobacterium sp.]|nr:gliding motility-associated peptidyl-prolyl isomerase GldI [Flavobacterium sp.]